MQRVKSHESCYHLQIELLFHLLFIIHYHLNTFKEKLAVVLPRSVWAVRLYFSLLKSYIYGQGAHTPFMLGLLCVNEKEMHNFSMDDVKHMINASEIPDAHYLYKASEKNVIPALGKTKLRSQYAPLQNKLI